MEVVKVDCMHLNMRDNVCHQGQILYVYKVAVVFESFKRSLH